MGEIGPELPGMANGIPAEFLEQVKQALENLYDFPALQRSPLARRLQSELRQSREAAGQQLRRQLIEAIEQLSPGSGVSVRLPHARIYSLLHLHYVEGMTIQEVAYELGISERQAYRDLRRAQESAAMLLWASYAHAFAPVESTVDDLSSLQAEVSRLRSAFSITDLTTLLHNALRAVDSLAARHGVELCVEASSEHVSTLTDPVVAQQVLVRLLSHAIQNAQGNRVQVALSSGGDTPMLRIWYAAREGGPSDVLTAMLVELMARLKWDIRQADAGDACEITLRLTTRASKVLIIDDNEGLVELLERYLSSQMCHVFTAATGQEGLERAQELVPDAIVLDVMMPGMDGWELLQRLRTNPATRAVPIVVCTVFNDPELAYSLGASIFLPKPVRRDDVLAALKSLGVV